MKTTHLILFALLQTLFACGQTNDIANTNDYPTKIGWVNDFEQLFSPYEAKILDSLISQYEHKTSVEIVILTVDSTIVKNEQFKNFALNIANNWHIGKPVKNNGILICISSQLRKIRIENAYGIEKRLTDGMTKKIIDETIIPNLKQGEYFQGALQGLNSIMKILDDNP
jgi:uncharacterized protein